MFTQQYASNERVRKTVRCFACCFVLVLFGCGHATAISGKSPGPEASERPRQPIDPKTAAKLARFFLPTFYQVRKTDEDAFVSATDYAFACDAVGFQPRPLEEGIAGEIDFRSRRLAEFLLGTEAAAFPPPELPARNIRLKPRAPRQSMMPAHGPVIYASVRPLSQLAQGRAIDRDNSAKDFYVIAYFVLLPFNRAPLDEGLRRLRTYDHEGDLESVQVAIEVSGTRERRILEIVMGNHGRRVLALPEAIEFDDRAGPGLHARIWFDEGSHEPFPFRGTRGLYTSKKGVLYTPKDGDFGGLRELFLRHDADPNELNAIRPSDVRLLPSFRLHSCFDVKAFAKEPVETRDAEFLMRFPGLYGTDDSPAGPPWNMWDLFTRSTVEYRPAPIQTDSPRLR
jgi:hypothetical protein